MLINLTPHAINIIDGPTLPPSGTVARCAVTRQQVGTVDGVTVNSTRFGAVDGLPAPAAGTYYIVSALVAQACPDRTDLLITDDAVRDDAGKIIGCRALATMHSTLPTQVDYGKPLELEQGTLSYIAGSEIANAVMAAALKMAPSPSAPGWGPLVEVAGMHRKVISSLPKGFDIESPTFCLSTGKNGKRPIYFVRGDGVYTLAVGTYFGNHSEFYLVTTVGDAYRLQERLLDSVDISRCIAAAEKDEKHSEVSNHA